MKVLFALLFVCFSISAVAQRSDTTWYYNPRTIQSIVTNDGAKVYISCWHQNGALMSSGTFVLRSAYIPASDVLVVDENSHKVQEYIFQTGTLINYLPGGIIKDSLHALLSDTAQHFIEYYTNGHVKKQWQARKDTGVNGIVFYPPHLNQRKISYMYQQTGWGYHHYAEYYPDGSIYKTTTYDPKVFYQHTWYKPTGEVDTSAYMGINSSKYQSIKQGRRLEWWNNGYLKSEENFKDDYKHGAHRSWHENGQQQMESFYANNSLDSILMIWYEDGRLKLYSDYNNRSSDGSSLSFYENGLIERQHGAIRSNYDTNGRLVYEHIGAGNYGIYFFDARNGKPNGIFYEGSFDKMRIGAWKAYHKNGQLIYSTFYENGLTEGETIIYDTLGHLRSKASYHLGRLQGPYLLMYENGKDTLSIGYYNNGKRWGIWKQFYWNGKLESVVEYGNNTYEQLVKYDEQGGLSLITEWDNRKHQKIQTHYQNGKPSSRYVTQLNKKNQTDSYEYFANGKPRRFIIYQKDGSTLERSWFENGNPEMITKRKDGQAFGKFEMWFANGNKRYEGEMKNGVRDGEWLYYNEDGSIASHPYFKNGVEVVLRPQAENCFCNQTYPPLKLGFMNSTESFLALKDVNSLMQRFQLDTGYSYSYPAYQCQQCFPMPVLAFRAIKMAVGKDGMQLNFTPCMQGHNYGKLNVNWFKHTHITNEYREYNDEKELLIPPGFSEAVARTISILRSWNDPFSYSQSLSSISGDEDLFQNFLEKNYSLRFAEKIRSGEEELEALDKAEEKYNELHPDDSISFDRHFANNFSALVLPFFPEQKKVLQKQPTNRVAINHILEETFGADMNELGKLLYGALDVQLDSGAVSLELPTTIISAYDSKKEKPLLKKGKPVPASFLLYFAEADYHSYPLDELSFSSTFNHCAQEFAVGSKGAWMIPGDFEFHFGSPVNAYQKFPFDPYDYPFHYKPSLSKIGDAQHTGVELDEYIQQFIGVIIRNGELNLPGLAAPVPVTNVLIDGKEMNGLATLSKNNAALTMQDLKQAFEKAGFKVMMGEDGEEKEGEEVVMFFQMKK